MTYTTQQLQAMSDFEVNKALAGKLGYEVESYTLSGVGSLCSISKGEEFTKLPDYCSSPNDIMPLAFERGISLIRVIDGYVAIKYDLYIDIGSHEDIEGICADGPQFGDTNPLRAIVCLLLIMED